MRNINIDTKWFIFFFGRSAMCCYILLSEDQLDESDDL